VKILNLIGRYGNLISMVRSKEIVPFALQYELLQFVMSHGFKDKREWSQVKIVHLSNA
jgi:hypothetical protein